MLASTSICFDLSVFELFLPLSTGGTIVLVENVLSLRSLAEASEVRLVNTVPSLMSEVLIEGSLPASVKTVNLAGEPLSAALVDELYDMGVERVFDLYGPSETTTYSTYALRERNGPETIGRPIANERVYVLDETMELVAAGESGELYIGGAGVARGYLNNPDLTAERFVADPFSGEPGARMYRTGDRVMWRANGTLVYLGRFDYQVKIRGFRIELGEVETALRSIDGISQAAVTVVTRGSAKLLAAFYVSRDGSVIANDKIRTPLLDVLPDYMIPAYFVHLSEFPLTPSGKLDRRSLPDPRQTTRPELTTPFVAASDDLERFIAERWQAILGLDRVGVNDPFFELGGDSLSAARFIREMQDELGEFLYVVAIFSAPTVARMATFLRKEYGPAILKRFGPSSVAPAVLQQQSNGVEVVDDEMIRQFDERIYRLPPADETVDAEPINDRAMFILAPPRSGTTLLRVMLAGHPGVFAASELQLLGFQTLAQRKTAYSGRHSLWLEGAVRAVKEIRDCSTEEAWELIGVFEQQGLSTRAFYRKLQEWLEGRVLLDKSPSYALDPASLAKAETDFESPFYIHLVRHPEAVIRSFEEYHLDQVLFLREHQFSSRQLAELVWSVSHRNVVRFLKGVAPERQIVVKFEQLVARPEETMKAVCRAAGLSYHEAVSRPYDDLGKRMTDGLHEDSIPMGDTKLLARDAIDPSAADTWKEKAGAHKLGEPTRKLAALFGYDLVYESVETKPIAESGAGARRAAYLAQMRDRRDRSVR